MIFHSYVSLPEGIPEVTLHDQIPKSIAWVKHLWGPGALFACRPWKPEPECWKSTIPRNSFFFVACFFCFLFGGPDANPMWWRHQSNLLRISMSQFYPTYGYFLINQHTHHESHMRLSENRVPRKFHCLHRALFSLLTVPSYPPFSDIPICI